MGGSRWDSPRQEDKPIPFYELSTPIKVLYGSLAGMLATALVHPLDVLKIRMQTYHHTSYPRDMAQYIYKCEGWKSFYTGIGAGFLRQATYTATRLAVYDVLYNKYKSTYCRCPTLADNVMMGIFAGLAGAMAGNPSEKALVRMVTDCQKLQDCCSCYYTCCQKEYTGVFQTLRKMSADEGYRSLWHGTSLTMGRSVIMSTVQIMGYIQIRNYLRDRDVPEGVVLHLITSIMSSFLSAAATMPVDVIKTRYQAVSTSKSPKQMLLNVVREKGVGFLWNGFLPYFVRLSAHTFLSFLLIEQLHQMFSPRNSKGSKRN